VPQYLDRAVTVSRGVVNGARSDRITFIAASLAYYGFVSMLPLLLLALVAAAVFGDAELVGTIVDEVTGTLGEQAGTLVGDALTGAEGRGGATVVGLAVLLWSGLKLFRGLDIAFSAVYGEPTPDSIVAQLRNAVVALGAVGLAVVATVVAGTAVYRYGLGDALEVSGLVSAGGVAALAVGLTIAFLPLYYFLPGADVSIREALPGAVFAALGWTLLQTGFRVYAASAGNYEAYGVLGAVLLLVTFLYFGALLLLLGAIFNAVLAGRADEDTGLAEPEAPPEPEPSAVLQGIMNGDRLDDDASDAELREDIERLYDELDRFEDRIDERTVHREEIESDLRRYVRRQVRRGKATGWGPYLVLLYGTAMTLGAFYFLTSGWAILAMLVVWLSTLGLYVLMVLVGTTVTVAGLPGRLRERFRDR
jgi:YihY family inner membrane protein